MSAAGKVGYYRGDKGTLGGDQGGEGCCGGTRSGCGGSGGDSQSRAREESGASQET
jgi:hypothetical protein